MSLNHPKLVALKRSSAKCRDDRREAFVRCYIIHQNASRAYREAGNKDGPSTRQSAHRLLTSADIQARIQERRQELLAALDLKVEDLVRRFRDIAFANIANIAGLHIGPCHFCYSVGHAYQWRTPREYQASLEEARQEVELDRCKETGIHPEGGYGYDSELTPHPYCPERDGYGIPGIVFKDTRLLTDSERAVLAGIEETRYGVSFHFHDRMAALQELAKRVGFYDLPRNRETNTVASLIQELQSRGQMQGVPLRHDRDPSE